MIVEITEHGEVIILDGKASPRFQTFLDAIEFNINNLDSTKVGSDGTTGGTGSAGAGNQYVEMTIDGTTYKVLHDGTV